MRATGLAQIATTQIVDTIYHADGTTATGTVLIAWPAFATINGDQVPSGNTNAVITQGGALTVSLIANSGSIPIGSYYTVTYHLDDNSVTRQYWVVPQSATPVKVAAVQSTVLPTSVAIQMATKTYVDTAIAVATTGHPLDSTPLVLKAGDTMTGPLILPADPVSSLQASTKHYVDSAIAASAATSGSITGQTLNYLPLATSGTASNTSSHFFESNSQGGVQNPFGMFTNASQCNYAGSNFTSCNVVRIHDDGSSPDNSRPGSLVGWAFLRNAWGGGHAGQGGFESRVSIGSNDQDGYSAIATAGIKQLDASGTSFFGIGDAAGIYHQNYCWAGVAYGSDQGCQNFLWLTNTKGHFYGTVRTGGTNTQPLFTFNGGCDSTLSYACPPSPGAWMIDTSAVYAAGKGTAAQSVGSAFGILSQFPTDQTNIPAVSVYGTALNVNLAPAASGWDSPAPTSITIGANGGSGVGSFAVGDHACVMGIDITGQGFVEQNIISAVSGSAGSQTITLPLSQPQKSVAVFKGDCMYLSFDADNAKGIRYALPAVSVDGSHILYTYPAFGSSFGGVLPAAGATFAVFDGGPNSGWHLYAGARVLKVGTTNPDYHPFDAQFLQTWLEPNSTFHVGDSVEGTNFHAQKVDGLELHAGMDTAAMPGNPLTGLNLHLQGYGASGASAMFRTYNDQQTFDSTTYSAFGGRLSEPQFISQAGPFDSILNADYTPLSNAFYFNNHQPGQNSYNIWRDPSWGTWSIDASGFHSSVDISGGSYRAFGLVSASLGLIAGQGDGAGNYAGLELHFPSGYDRTSTWLTPCSEKPLNGEPITLCVTSQGASRSGYTVTADRDLAVNNLTVNGAMPSLNIAPPSGHALIELTPAGADQYLFFANSTDHDPGWFGVYNAGKGTEPLGLYSSDGTHSFAVLDPNTVLGFTSAVETLPDSGISRLGPASLAVGNGTKGDTSGSISAAVYQGPATAPNGACSTVGWAFSQDGHISYCNGSTWTQKM
jgi:hypothetical protein